EFDGGDAYLAGEGGGRRKGEFHWLVLAMVRETFPSLRADGSAERRPTKNSAKIPDLHQRPDCFGAHAPRNDVVGKRHGIHAAMISCRCSPRPSMPSVTTSPTLRNFGGFMPMPTPGGVPVAITSPGISVIISERYDTIFLTPKIMVAVDPVWQRSPLTSAHIDSFCTSAISSLVTTHWPSGPKVSCDLPLVHCPRRSIWKKRSETSLQTQ